MSLRISERRLFVMWNTSHNPCLSLTDRSLKKYVTNNRIVIHTFTHDLEQVNKKAITIILMIFEQIKK